MTAEVRFTAEGEGTRVDLEHRGFERLGEVAAETSAEYGAGSGWDTVLGQVGKAANISG